MNKSKICIVLGTRPEIIKLSPIIRECIRRKLNFFVVHTNQHYDSEMDNIFFKELELPSPKYNLNVRSGTHGETTGKALIGIEKVLIKEKPDIVLAEGDTNSVLAAALAASKLHIPFGHIEAGLRSFYRKMPEEINRIVVDHISDYLFVPTEEIMVNVRNEGLPWEKIYCVGNTIVDAIKENIVLANKKSNILSKLSLKEDNFCLLTFHREENTDKKEKIQRVFLALAEIQKKANLSIIFPIHPRTTHLLKRYNIKPPKWIQSIDPVGYLDALLLIKHSFCVFTDSGGIQEEACILGTPCITLRENTERPETVNLKANTLVGTDNKKIINTFINLFNNPSMPWKHPYGDGTTAKKIIDEVLK